MKRIVRFEEIGVTILLTPGLLRQAANIWFCMHTNEHIHLHVTDYVLWAPWRYESYDRDNEFVMFSYNKMLPAELENELSARFFFKHSFPYYVTDRAGVATLHLMSEYELESTTF